MNTKLLKKLYAIYSPSMGEQDMVNFIHRWVKSNVTNADIRHDGNNIYITKGESETYPCVVAHLDQLQTQYPHDYRVIQNGKYIFAWSPQSGCCGLGADDKNGIWVALECLKKYDAIKVAFFWGEETGCNGSGMADMDFFKDVRFVIQCDRRGSSDLITNIMGETCSKEFLDATGYEEYGYHPQDGMMTDILALKENGLEVSAVNMSCGYYNPHSEEEYTNIEDLEKCFRFVCHIIETCTVVYPHKEYDCCSQKNLNGYSFSSGYKGQERKFTDPWNAFDEGFDPYDDDFEYNEVYDRMAEIVEGGVRNRKNIIWHLKKQMPDVSDDLVEYVYNDVAFYYNIGVS